MWDPAVWRAVDARRSRSCVDVWVFFQQSDEISTYLAAVDGRSGSILFQVSEVADLDGTVRKARNDLQLPAHRLDMAAQRRDVHIGAPLELRDRGLLYVQGLCQHFLR